MILRKNPVSVSNSHDSSFVVSWSVELSEIEDIFGSRTGTRKIDWLVSAISVATASKGKMAAIFQCGDRSFRSGYRRRA
jgi:hypothetical protein